MGRADNNRLPTGPKNGQARRVASRDESPTKPEITTQRNDPSAEQQPRPPWGVPRRRCTIQKIANPGILSRIIGWIFIEGAATDS